MEIVGGGRVHVYEPVDEGTHNPGPQKDWQESVVLFWYDFKQSIGGFYRIGHEMNQPDGPMVTSWATTFTPDGTYKKYSYLPLRPQDRTANHVGSADTSCAYDYDGNCVWTLDSEDLTGTIRVHDFHPSIDCYPQEGRDLGFRTSSPRSRWSGDRNPHSKGQDIRD